MSDELRALALMLCAANPAAVTLAARGRIAGWPVAAAAFAAAGLLAVLAGAFAGPLVDALNTTGPSLGLAAGAVMLATGAVTTVMPGGERGMGDSWRDGLFPLGFPLVFNPAVATGALHLGANEGTTTAIVAGLVACGVCVAAAWWTGTRWRSGVDALARLTGAGLVLVAVTIVVDSVKAV